MNPLALTGWSRRIGCGVALLVCAAAATDRQRAIAVRPEGQALDARERTGRVRITLSVPIAT